jgi:hypothetical protein
MKIIYLVGQSLIFMTNYMLVKIKYNRKWFKWHYGYC